MLKIATIQICLINIAIAFGQTNYNVANMQREKSDRGLVAIRHSTETVSVSWRLLPDDDLDIEFDIYRAIGKKKPIKLNSKPISQSTFYIDSIFDTQHDLTYSVHRLGEKTILDQYTLIKKMQRNHTLKFLLIK